MDAQAGTIVVVGAASEVRGQLQFGPTKTGKSRMVGIPQSMARMLADHMAGYQSADGFVFTAGEGGPIRHRNVYRRHFRPAVEKANNAAVQEDRETEAIPLGLRFHDLRHTCAALLIANGRHMEEVKAHLGHSSIRVTSDRYGHLFPSARQGLAESLEATFQDATASAQTDEGRTKLRVVPSDPVSEATEKASDQVVSLERTTGFEPATLTLAR